MTKPRYAIMDEAHNIIVTPDFQVDFENEHSSSLRTVAMTSFDTFNVSTVFLGINHSHQAESKNLWFESLSWDLHTDEIERYETWQEALDGHVKLVIDAIAHFVRTDDKIKKPGFDIEAYARKILSSIKHIPTEDLMELFYDAVKKDAKLPDS